MTLRLLIAACLFVLPAATQNLPAYQWTKEVDESGTDSLAGLGTDSQGNIYVAGSTLSRNFPVKNAVQGSIASSGLYRIGAGTYTALGLNSAESIAVDPLNPGIIYATSLGVLLRSSDGGITFGPISLPGSEVGSIAIEPGNDQVLFAATGDRGVLKSADGGITWTPLNNGLTVQNGQVTVENLFIDPASPAVILAETPNGLASSIDGAATWQLTTISDNIQNVTFDTANPGVVYVSDFHTGVLKSTDYGQTFTLFEPFSAPLGISEALPDQNHPGQLIGVGSGGLFVSTDGGSTWTQESATPVTPNLAPDWANGVFYAASANDRTVLRISGDLKTVTSVGPPATAFIRALVAANGQVYAGNDGSTDVFVTKLDPLGNIVYSTYFGGSADDSATSMAVDPAGDVFVTGTTSSLDLPVSKGAYATSGSVFIFKLNPDGSLGYSTYFSGTAPVAIATDGSGSAWLAGNTDGGLPVTPGALSTTFCCGTIGINIGPPIIADEASLTRFDSSGSSLTFSTYVAGSSVTSVLGTEVPASALAVASDGTAYVGGAAGIFHLDPAGSTLLSSMPASVDAASMAFAPDGSLYIAGFPGAPGATFKSTPGTFQPTFAGPPNLPDQGTSGPQVAIERVDAGLKNVIAATYFSNVYSNQVNKMAIDSAGNVYVGGNTAPLGLPARTPFAEGFASPTGFMSELSSDLSTLIFSSYFGDTENFTVSGLGIGANGSVVIGGVTGQGAGPSGRPTNLWLNSLSLTPPPALRVDAVENAASLLDGPISAGETIVVKGAGFGSDARLSIGGEAVAPLSIAPGAIAATVPADIAVAAAAVQVQSGGATSNQVLAPVAVTSPGIFSADGTGYGQGYILNKDGTLNTPANPAAPGDRITIYATGVGPVSFTQGYAVTEFPVNVFMEYAYCAGVGAMMGPISGFPGNVYRITVYVPNPPVAFPPLVGVVMQIDGLSSQQGIAISIAQ